MILIVAILLGQFTGGNACCCWIRQCLAPVRNNGAGLDADGEQAVAFACPKCLARYKKAQGAQDQLHGAPCRCADHSAVTIFQDPDLESRVRVEMMVHSIDCPHVWLAWHADALAPSVPVDFDADRWEWQSRACIWRI
jgi:hypothetical protein